MRNLLIFLAICVGLFTVSCQKELDDPSINNPSDSAGTTRLVKIVDLPAMASDDSVVTYIKYKDKERQIVFYEDDSINPYVHLQYDEQGYLTEEVYFDFGSVVDYKTYFRRNSSKYLAELEYDLFGPQQVGQFVRQLLSSGNYAYSFKDSNMFFQFNKTAVLNTLDKPVERVANFTSDTFRNVARYIYNYNSTGELNNITYKTERVLDSNRIERDSVVIELVYESKEAKILNTFVAGIGGKDLRWFESHPASYMTHIKDYFESSYTYSPKPFRKTTSRIYKFENNLWRLDAVIEYSYENVFDRDGNLIERKFFVTDLASGQESLGGVRFYYEKIK
jgi:hypothetical protein